MSKESFKEKNFPEAHQLGSKVWEVANNVQVETIIEVNYKGEMRYHEKLTLEQKILWLEYAVKRQAGFDPPRPDFTDG